MSLKRFVVLMAVPFLVAACSGKDRNPLSPSSESSTVVRVEIVGKSEFVVGEQYQLRAMAHYSDGTQRDVTSQSQWNNFNSGAISVHPSTGLLTAIKVGKCGVVATFEGRTGTLSVVVVDGGSVPDGPVTGLVVQGNPSVGIGQTTQWQPIALYGNGVQRNVTGASEWTSSAPGTAAVSAGLITGIARGTATIGASYQGRNASGAILVTDGGTGPAVDSLRITGNTNIRVGETTQLEAEATLSDGSNLPVTAAATWTSANPDNAPVVSGLVTGESVGQVEIQAAYGGRTASTAVTISAGDGPGPGPGPGAGAIVISGPGCTVAGESGPLTATVNGTDVTSQASWSSSNGAVASVNSSGQMACAGPGTTTVTAALPPHTPGTRDVTVTPAGPGPEPGADLIGLELEVPVNLTVADLLNGDPIVNAKLFGLYSNGSRNEVTAACVSIDCLVSPSNLIDVDRMGTAEVVVLLLRGLLDPDHQVNAVYGGYTANANVTLQLPALQQIAIGNGGPLGLNLTNNNQLPSLQTLFSQGITSTVDAGADGVTYDIELGGPLSAAIDALPSGAGALLRTTVINPALDTLQVVDGRLSGDVSRLNALLAALAGNPALEPLLGPGGAVPLDLTATAQGVTSTPVRLNLGN